jgi:hypothetical protein
MRHDRLAPAEALDRLFDVIRQEAAANPTFARRMLDAVGVTVVFSGAEAAVAADPVLLAARGDAANFRESFATFSEKDLKALIKAHRLATDEQVKAVTSKPKQAGLVDLMWNGARRKLSDRSVA